MNVLATTGGWQLTVFLAASAVVLIVPAIVLSWIVVASYINDDGYRTAVGDVQRFLELTDRSRQELTVGPRLPLLDVAGGLAASKAVSRSQVLKAEARREIWPRLK